MGTLIITFLGGETMSFEGVTAEDIRTQWSTTAGQGWWQPPGAADTTKVNMANAISIELVESPPETVGEAYGRTTEIMDTIPSRNVERAEG